jgi:hypothetical protein
MQGRTPSSYTDDNVLFLSRLGIRAQSWLTTAQTLPFYNLALGKSLLWAGKSTKRGASLNRYSSMHVRIKGEDATKEIASIYGMRKCESVAG